MNLKVISYDDDLVEDFHYFGIERKYVSSDKEVRKVIRECSKREGETIVGVIKGMVFFFAGIYALAPRVGEAWAFVNPVPSNEKIATHRAIFRNMHRIALDMNLVRLQSLCFPLEKAKRFLEALGFEKEAVLRKYYRGREDLILYSIIWGDRCR